MSSSITSEYADLHWHHYRNCEYYKNLSDNIFEPRELNELEDLPYVPAGLFKKLELKSVPNDEIIKTLISSGTTGQKRSKIFLSAKNAKAQQKALIEIVIHALGASRAPLLVLDTESQLRSPPTLTARSAGILGFMIFGTKRFFALSDNYDLDRASLSKFVDIKSKKNKLIYGFTSIIWEEFLQKVDPGANLMGDQNCILIHGGGWKKLSDKNITASSFNEAVKSRLGQNIKIFDYYGMVEQTGSIFLGCEAGYLHTNEYNNILIRNPATLEPVKNGSTGIVQVLSSLAVSYPGSSILTEDLGVIHGNEKCICGKAGKFFEILGRLPETELRGCSNTYER